MVKKRAEKVFAFMVVDLMACGKGGRYFVFSVVGWISGRSSSRIGTGGVIYFRFKEPLFKND